MRFEHLVEVNDVLSPLAVFVTREQLWQGLVLRAEHPELFVPSLSEATILQRSDTHLVRALRYGDVTITDEVFFVPLEHVHYDIAAQGEIARSSLRMSIEEPRPSILFVRFVYEDERSAPADGDAALFDEFRRAAYEEADIATVGTIRSWIEGGGHSA